jgi:hypothetical protein
MRRSTVVGPRGESVVDDIRTSYGMFIKRLHDPIITNIEKRISVSCDHLPHDTPSSSQWHDRLQQACMYDDYSWYASLPVLAALHTPASQPSRR